MHHADHVALLRDGITTSSGTWADLGSGSGAFTLALAELLGPGARIHAIDRDERALREAAGQVERRFPDTQLTTHVADLAAGLPIPADSLDGVVMANSLHFFRQKEPILRTAIAAIRPGGRFLLVEYGSDRGNPWVPWPISYQTWERLALNVGLLDTRRIGQVPSRFLGSIYAAASDVA